jgi:hypothetical protein
MRERRCRRSAILLSYYPTLPAAFGSRETQSDESRFGWRKVAFAAQLLGLKVAGYRLYCLDGADKVASADWIEADDDEAAIEVARERLDGQECELWQRARLVARLNFRDEKSDEVRFNPARGA